MAQTLELTVDLTSTTNPVYFPLYDDQSPYLVLYGGGGSGKSVFAAQKILARIVEEQDHSFLVVRKVQRTVKDSVFALFRKLIRQYGLGPVVKIVESPMPRITFPLFRSEIIFSGMDDEEKLKSITSTATDTLTGIWVEEPTECTQDDFEQLIIRLRGQTKHYQQIILSFNPIHEMHWLKAFWFDRAHDDARILKTTYRDNRFLTSADRKRLEDLKDTNIHKYRVYCLGEWGSYGDLVFDPNRWTVERIRYAETEYDRVYNGADFGFNDPSCILRVGVKDSEIYVFREFYERGLTNTDLIAEARHILPAGASVTCDSAEPARIEEFCRAGFVADSSVKGPDSITAGIDFLMAHKIHIDDRCVNTIREFQTLEWRKDRAGKVKDRELAASDDHAVAALRYAIEPWRLDQQPAEAVESFWR